MNAAVTQRNLAGQKGEGFYGWEKSVSDFILNWALDQGLKAKQDAVNNVFIRKAASAGYEAAPPVMLQAHMDMVCEKNEGVNHDFGAGLLEFPFAVGRRGDLFRQKVL